VLSIPAGDETYSGVGIWIISGTREDPKLTYAVSPFAREFSGWGNYYDTKAGKDMWFEDSDASDLQRYLGG